MFNLPANFQPTDEWAKNNTGQSLADYYKSNPGAQQAAQQQQTAAENTPAALMQEATDAYNKQLADYNAKYAAYNEANPFVLDDVLASETAKAKQSLDPYYQQTLSDFLTGINTQRAQGAQDQSTLLSNLAEDRNTFTGQQGQALQDTLDKTRQGFAGNGLYNSGANLNAQGRNVADTNESLASNLTDTNRKIDQTNLAGERANTALDLQTGQEKTQLGEQEATAVGTQANAAVKSDAGQNLYAEGQATGPPPGADPTAWNTSLASYLTA